MTGTADARPLDDTMKSKWLLLLAPAVLILLPLLLYFCGCRRIFSNSYFDLTYHVHDGSDPALEYVSGRGDYETIEFEDLEQHVRTQLQKLGMNDPDNLDWVAGSLCGSVKGDESGNHLSPVPRAHLQDGCYYVNRQIGILGVGGGGVGGRSWKVIRWELLPKPVDMCVAYRAVPWLRFDVRPDDGTALPKHLWPGSKVAEPPDGADAAVLREGMVLE